jgi:hypothetical protein
LHAVLHINAFNTYSIKTLFLVIEISCLAKQNSGYFVKIKFSRPILELNINKKEWGQKLLGGASEKRAAPVCIIPKDQLLA